MPDFWTPKKKQTSKEIAEEQFARGLKNLVVPSRITSAARTEQTRLAQAGATRRTELDIAAAAPGREATTASTLATAGQTRATTEAKRIENIASRAVQPGLTRNVLAQQAVTGEVARGDLISAGQRTKEAERAKTTDIASFPSPGGLEGVPKSVSVSSLAQPRTPTSPSRLKSTLPEVGVDFLEKILKRGKGRKAEDIIFGGGAT